VRNVFVIALIALILGAAGVGIATFASAGGVPERTTAAQPAAAEVTATEGKTDYPAPRPRVAVAVAPGEEPPPGAVTGDEGETAGSGSARDAARSSDDEIRAELAEFKKALRSSGPGVDGPRAKVLPNGQAVPPRNAPAEVKAMIAAGNTIAREPYKWGGGHGAWQDDGYDCSGSVSFALAGAGLLSAPLNSTGFMDWGDEGEGKWVTIYANHGHVFMYVAGIRFDTSGRGSSGSRWQTAGRDTGAYTAVHPPGL
jgi:cell wall-associated NlpC family hydrolase